MLASKPGEEEREALEDVRRSWRRAGSDVDVYCPGKRRTLVAAPEADSVAPTERNEEACDHQRSRNVLVVLVYP